MGRPEDTDTKSASARPPQTLRRRFAAVTVPSEHGGWGLALEPILLGLLVAPSLAGTFFAIAVLIGFLSRQSAKIVAIDRRRHLRNERTVMAERVVIAYGLIATLFFLLTWSVADDRGFLLPLVLAMPFALLFAYYDLSRPGRTLQAELSGPTALAAVTASMAMLAGWPLREALPLWVVLVARAVPAVLYVRVRLRLDRGRVVNTFMPMFWHLLALAVVAGLAWVSLLPWTAVLAMVILLIRCVFMLLPQRPRVAVKTIGFSELGLGLLTVFLVAVGYWLQ